jgi:hypothetical protein
MSTPTFAPQIHRVGTSLMSLTSTSCAAYKYAEDPKAGLLANANTGGENVARGAVLGAVYGAGLGMKVPQCFPQAACCAQILCLSHY